MPARKRKKEPEILPGAQIVDLALYLEKEQALVFSDLHFGIEEALKEQGMLAPRFNYQDIADRLNRVFAVLEQKKLGLQAIIITGDIKHEFGRASSQEWGEIIDFLRFLQPHAAEIVLIKGNHDSILEPICHWEKIRARREYYLETSQILVVHGDEIPLSSQFEKSQTVIMGHVHPALTLREGEKNEKYKCFLKGKFQGKTVVVLPAFNSYSEGSNILQGTTNSPFLQENLEKFEAWAIEDKPYYFGKIGKLMKKTK